MIYLVTGSNGLFENTSSSYEIVSVEKALEILEPMEVVGLDTETEGFDVHTKRLLSLQLGTFNNQVVIDCSTVDVTQFKDYLESDRLFLGWNLKFDLKFLWHKGILLKRLYDGFLAEKLLWLGYPSGFHEMSLKAAGHNYLGVELDKSVRGEIIKKGLTERVIVYAADDVKYLEAIREKQFVKLTEQGLLKAIELENEFLKPCFYFEYCGAKIDPIKWANKVSQDREELTEVTKALNSWVEDFYNKHSSDKYCVTIDYCFEERLDGVLEPVHHTPTFEYEPVSGYDLVRVDDDERGIHGDFLYQKIKRKFPFVRIDTQGDLFGGFDPSPRCCINWDSNKQVVPIMEFFGINCSTIDPKTKMPKKSVDKKVIKSQSEITPLVDLYLEYKKISIQVDTFGDKFLELLNPKTHRLHCNFNQLGTDTGRLSSTGPNLQNLPAKPTTRSCFIAEEGNKWLSADYNGQESFLMASIANDKAMLKELIEGSGDLHSLTAKMVFSEIPKELSTKEIKATFPLLRKKAKGYEFLWNYGGGPPTLVRNFGLTYEEAVRLDTLYRQGFYGLAAYQKLRRKEVMRLGYILLSPLTGHKAYIYDYDRLKKQLAKQRQPGFWDIYRQEKETNPNGEIVQEVRRLAKRRAESEKQSINYPIQAAGAFTFKIACIKFFNYLLKNNLLSVVLFTIPAHDEINCECPAEIADTIGQVLLDCMERAGAIFCTRAKLTADLEIGDHWIH